MSSQPRWNFSKISAWAEVTHPSTNVKYPLEITKLDLLYWLNRIPEATLAVTAGREVLTNTAATLHSLVNDLKILTPVTVYVKVQELANSEFPGDVVDHWPAAAFVAFYGYVSGVGIIASSGSGSYFNLKCTHFLNNLDYSFSAVQGNVPFSPAQFSSAAALPTGAGVRHLQGHTIFKGFINATKLEQDFWHNCLQAFFAYLCTQSATYANEVALGQSFLVSNGLANRALCRFEPLADDALRTDILPHDGYIYAHPLAFINPVDSVSNQPILNFDSVINSITNYISRETYEALYSITLWDKLIEFATDFGLAVVPMNDRALLVPWTPTLGVSGGFKTIYTREYDSLQVDQTLHRPLRSLAIYSGTGSLAGPLGLQGNQQNNISTIGGFYLNPSLRRGGTAMLIQGRQWVMDMASSDAWGAVAALPSGAKATTFNPVTGSPNPPSISTPDIVIPAIKKNIWDNYAKLLYSSQVFAERQASLSGRLRFDISPGSIVQVQCLQEKFIVDNNQQPLSYNLYGYVDGVQICIDSEQQTASTRLQLSHLRTQAEFNDPYFSLAQHPFFKVSSNFYGAPLVNHLQFVYPTSLGQ